MIYLRNCFGCSCNAEGIHYQDNGYGLEKEEVLDETETEDNSSSWDECVEITVTTSSSDQ